MLHIEDNSKILKFEFIILYLAERKEKGKEKERVRYKTASLILALLMVAPMLALIRTNPAYAATSTLTIVNPGPDGYPAKWTAGPDTADQGTKYFNFTTDDTDYGDTFFVNVTVTTHDLKAWGFGLIYDNTTLEYVSAWRPTDHVFKGAEDLGVSMVAPAVVIAEYDATHQEVQWGCSYIMPDPPWTFNGTGVEAQVEFRIIASANRKYPLYESVFNYDPAWTGVYYYPSGNEVPDCPDASAYFQYKWIEPTTVPDFYVKPAFYQNSALKKGDDVAIEVWVKNVAAGWSIVAFQFSLWFNTSCLGPGPAGTSYEVGTWMQGFISHNEAVMYAAYDDYHGVDPELPLCWNKWFAGIFIVPGDLNQYWPPFPSGEGMLFRFHMKVLCETIFPNVENTTLTLHDLLVYDQFGLKVGISTPENGTVQCPVRTLGLAIDLYTCRDGVLQNNGLWVTPPAPYGGQGPNNPSDMFEPQAEVDLQALVVYNEDPVQQKLVSFEIHSPHDDYIIYRENYTDVNGIAWIKFRIPWPCDDPVGKIFGEWKAIATVEVAKQIVNDTMPFKVWWPVEIVSVTAKDTTYVKYKPSPETMEFVVEFRTLRMQPISVLLTVDVYDELGFHIGSDKFVTTVGWDSYTYCQFINYTHTFAIPMPTNAVVGVATVYADAYTDFPWLGGVPYCPEASNTFYILKSP
jgi:hypothetical protein